MDSTQQYPRSTAAAAVPRRAMFLFPGADPASASDVEVSHGSFTSARMAYGLYIFHIAMLQLSTWRMSPLHLAYDSPVTTCPADGIALAFAVSL